MPGRRLLLSLISSLALAPLGWPQHLALGLTDPPGDAHALVSRTHVDARYQYLAGGVNTGHGWATWNPGASFASMYVRESIAAHVIPVLTYYQLLQSNPSQGSDELTRDLSNLRDGATMRAYWTDFTLLLRRVAAGISAPPGHHPRRTRPVGVPRAGSGDRARPRLRPPPARPARPLAPHVRLAWHSERVGHRRRTRPTRSRRWRTWTRSASSRPRFYALSAPISTSSSTTSPTATPASISRSRATRTPLGGRPTFTATTLHRRLHPRTHTPVVLWQLPLGNTLLNDTWGHYRDNRVQWWLADPSGAHLRATRAAGVIGLLFGAGAAGTTSAGTDGGLFYRLARAYERQPLAL